MGTSKAFKESILGSEFIDKYNRINGKFNIDKYVEFVSIGGWAQLSLDDPENYVTEIMKNEDKELIFYAILFELSKFQCFGSGLSHDPDLLKEVLNKNVETLRHSIQNLFTQFQNDRTISEFDNICLFENYNKHVGGLLGNIVISFEGIDATGKQTLSGLLEDFILFMDPNYAVENPDIIKVNIPNYNIPSGQQIAQTLKDGDYNPKELQMQFALNRKEVQNTINQYNVLSDSQSNIKGCWEPGLEVLQKNRITIFDRWTDSAVAFRVAKEIKTIINSESMPVLSLVSSLINHDTNKFNIRTLTMVDFIKIMEAFPNLHRIMENQYNLEHNVLGLVRPDIKFLCVAPTKVIEERIKARAKANGINEEELDSHEKDLDYLFLVQMVYKYIFDKNIVDNKNYKGIVNIINTHENNIIESAATVILELLSPLSKIQNLISSNKLIQYKLINSGIVDKSLAKDMGSPIVEVAFNKHYEDLGKYDLKNSFALKPLKEKVQEEFKLLYKE